MSTLSDLAKSALPFIVRSLPDVARALSSAADRGELEPDTVDAVRGKLPPAGEAERALAELQGVP